MANSLVTVTLAPFLLLCLTLVTSSCTFAGSSAEENSASKQKYRSWIRRGLNFMRNISCDTVGLRSRAQCEEMKLRLDSQINVYVAEPPRKGSRIFGSLPDGDLQHSGDHHALIGIDPFPQAPFGHLLLLFFVDFENKIRCDLTGGSYSNSMEENVTEGMQLLRCMHLPEYASCPSFRGNNSTDGMACESVICQRNRQDALQNSRCRLFEVCDHAVVIQGGWNQLISRKEDFRIVQRIIEMLETNHVPPSNIKIFFANGKEDAKKQKKGSRTDIFPAASKNLLRCHIRDMCSRACVESLTVFIRGPVLTNGSLLLWDTNQNGIAEHYEMYSTEELLDDLKHCRAKQVILLLDHSYAGWTSRNIRLNPSKRHLFNNLRVYASTDITSFPDGSRFTDFWLESDHRRTCTNKVYENAMNAGVVRSKSRRRSMAFEDVKSEKRTMFGAPCRVFPAFTDEELREKYYGCQNVPTLLWFSRTPVRNNQRNFTKKGKTGNDIGVQNFWDTVNQLNESEKLTPG